MAGLDPAIEKTMLDAQPQNPAFCGLAHRRSGKKRITCQLCLADVRLLAAARQGLGRPMIIKPIEFISGNKLLNALAASALERLDPHIERIEAGLGAVICEAGGMLHHAYFPETSVLSLLTVLKNGAAIETANIGREGLFGLAFVMYKPSHGCFNRCIVQLPGSFIRVPASILRREYESNAQIRDLFASYTGALLAQIQQTVACNAVHNVQQRVCRWLLIMHDRASGDELMYTHEFLAEMIGANRKSVTLVAQALQRAGMIEYHRGKIKILDRRRLEQVACECYVVIKKRFEDLLTVPQEQQQASDLL
jgi:CRP-like cAMP-binding protein